MALIDQPEERFVAVRHVAVNPWPRRLIIAAVILIISISGFFVTLLSTDKWYAELQAERDRLAVLLAEQTDINESLRRELATIKAGALVDRQAADLVRIDLRDQQNTIARLKQSVQFYENLMNPSAGHQGLDAYGFLLYRSDQVGVYRFRLVIQQLGAKQRMLKVSSAVLIHGILDEQDVDLKLEDILLEPSQWPSKFSFKYYYNAEGTLRLPQGFEPKNISVSLTAPKKPTKNFQFDWHVMEN